MGALSDPEMFALIAMKLWPAACAVEGLGRFWGAA